jgi:hypothetical protein
VTNLSPQLTPDQQHLFAHGQQWADFRALFSSQEAAIAAHIRAAQPPKPDQGFSHELEWRLIYHDSSSRWRQLLLLSLLPLGHFATSHVECRFTTFHAFSPAEVRNIWLGRVLGSACYHLCFAITVLAGVATAVLATTLTLAGIDGRFDPRITFFCALSAVVFLAAIRAAKKSRAIGLPLNLRRIAKDAFDLVSIRRIASYRD